MKDFVDDSAEAIKKLEVIDQEAETEDSLEDSYEGKVILSCNVCHTDVFEDPTNIEIKDDETVIPHECPFCHTTNEFTIKGQVVPFEVKDEKEDDEDEVKVEVEEKEEKDESLTEAKDNKTPAIATLLVKDKDKLNKCTSNDDLIKLIDSYYDKTDDHAYLDYMKKEIRRQPFEKSLMTVYNVMLKPMGLGSLDYKIKKSRQERESLKEDTQAANVVDKYQEWVDYDMKKYHKISDITKKKLDKAGFQVVKDDHGDYEVIAKDKKELGEAFEKVEIETDSEKIKIETESKDEMVEDTESTEVIEPVSKETEKEILDKNDMEEVEEEEDVAIDEFEESLFSRLGTSYLKENYNNVKSFTTKTVKESNNGFIIEGVINFKNGNTRNTKFVFEAATISNSGKAKFLGENVDFETGKNSFTLRGTIKNKQFISESLAYNYKTIDPDTNKKVQIYGKSKIR